MPAGATTVTAPAASRTRSGPDFGTANSSISSTTTTTSSIRSTSNYSRNEDGNGSDDQTEHRPSKPQLKSRKSTTEWIDADRRNSSFFLRSSPSRSHLRYWNRTKSAVVSASATRKNMVVSDPTSQGLDAAPMPRIFKTEFQNLPSSVQRKVSLVFSLHSEKAATQARPPSLATASLQQDIIMSAQQSFV